MVTILKSDLLFDYPSALVATKPQYPPRVLLKEKKSLAKEISFADIFSLFDPNDVLLVNQTKVLPRRVFLKDLDIMFLDSEDQKTWQVLFPAKKYKIGDKIELPENIKLTLVEKGIPQVVNSEKSLDNDYFIRNGFFALPPYIQVARGQSLPYEEDKDWYQTVWAKNPGSLAAPTASLHFKKTDFERLRNNVNVCEVTLHVGLGTFLPVSTEMLTEHKMHKEYVFIERQTVEKVKNALSSNQKIWALGTTSLRSIEAWARGHLQETPEGWVGETDLFLKPGDEFKVCSGLLTNFHQPGSTLIALVSAFSSLDEVKKTYRFAIENEFRLFSYGDLSVWIR